MPIDVRYGRCNLVDILVDLSWGTNGLGGRTFFVPIDGREGSIIYTGRKRSAGSERRGTHNVL